MGGANKGGYSAFGRLLRQYRASNAGENSGGISRTGLSTLLGGTISAAAIEKYERGERRPPPHFISRLAPALNLTGEQIEALIQATEADRTSAYLEEYREVSGDRAMTPDMPDEMKRKLSGALAQTVDFELRLHALGDPDFIALGATGGVVARNRASQAQAAMQHLALSVQVARYHIYLANYERVRHRDYLVPPNPAGGDVSAAFLFNSFALHMIVVEGHLIISLATRFGLRNRSGSGPNESTQEVLRYLVDGEHTAFAEVLRPFRHDPRWQWLHNYRDRWVHGDPVRVKELGEQFSSTRDYWKDEGTALTLAISGSDPAETTVGEMLAAGVYCFNLMARQINRYISLLEESRQRQTQQQP